MNTLYSVLGGLSGILNAYNKNQDDINKFLAQTGLANAVNRYTALTRKVSPYPTNYPSGLWGRIVPYALEGIYTFGDVGETTNPQTSAPQTPKIKATRQKPLLVSTKKTVKKTIGSKKGLPEVKEIRKSEYTPVLVSNEKIGNGLTQWTLSSSGLDKTPFNEFEGGMYDPTTGKIVDKKGNIWLNYTPSSKTILEKNMEFGVIPSWEVWNKMNPEQQATLVESMHLPEPKTQANYTPVNNNQVPQSVWETVANYLGLNKTPMLNKEEVLKNLSNNKPVIPIMGF